MKSIGQNIKIYVACHVETHIAQLPFLQNIQVGASLCEKRFEDCLYDHEGEHISEKNRQYCELTAQYWAWKNQSAEYYGFFHYRRFLYPDVTEKSPYILRKSPSQETFQQLSYDKFPELIAQYDVILPKAENMWISVEKHYGTAKYHHKSDVDLLKEIVGGLYPQYVSSMEAYFAQSSCYFGNIFIMKDALFQEYMPWLFSILEEFEQRKDFSHYSPEEARVLGYLGERLLGIYVYQLQETSRAKILHLPRVHFVEEDGVRRRQGLLNILLPSGSWRRSCVKKLYNLRGNQSL